MGSMRSNSMSRRTGGRLKVIAEVVNQDVTPDLVWLDSFGSLRTLVLFAECLEGIQQGTRRSNTLVWGNPVASIQPECSCADSQWVYGFGQSS